MTALKPKHQRMTLVVLALIAIVAAGLKVIPMKRAMEIDD